MNGIEITNINMTLANYECRVRKDGGYRKVLANFNIILNNCFAINSISLIMREDNSAFVAFYSRKDKETNQFYNICYPTKKELREYIEDVLINYYNEHQHDNEESKN